MLQERIDSLDIQRSIEDYSQAINLDSTFWQAYRNRSRLYHKIKQFDRAIEDLTLALNYSDSNSAINLYDMRAYSYYALGQYPNAIADWSIAVENLGNPSLALLQRAKAEWLIGEKEKSCSDFIRATQLDKGLVGSKEFIKCE